MRPVLSGLLAVLLASVTAASHAADWRERSINQRQHNQEFRTREAFRGGDMTRGTARQFQHEARDTDRGRHDGERRFGFDRGHPGFAHGPGWGYPGVGNGYAYGHSPARAFERRVDRIEHYERHRIAQGLRTGALTRDEARQLVAEQRALEAKERRYLADGIVTRAERADLLSDLNAAARHIYNETHDAEVRR